MMKQIYTIFALLPLLTGMAVAQKSITADDYTRWQTISGARISENGALVSYEINVPQGDGYLIVKDLNKTIADTLYRGSGASFGHNSKSLVYLIKPPVDVVKEAKRKKVKADDMPDDSLGVYQVTNRTVTKFPQIKSFALSELATDWVVFLGKPVVLADTASGKGNNSKKPENNDLFTLHIPSGDTVRFTAVTDYKLAENGRHLVIAREQKDSTTTRSTLLLFNTDTRERSSWFSSEGWIKGLTIDKAGNQVAFLHSPDTAKTKVYAVYHGRIAEANPALIADRSTVGMPLGWSPSEFGNPRYSDDGSKLYFGTAPKLLEEDKDDLLPEEKPMVDVWHWQDKQLQSQQKVTLNRDRRKTHLAVYFTQQRRYMQLADLNITDIATNNKGNSDTALGFDDTRYQLSASWEGSRRRDIYLVDLRSGIKRLMLEGQGFAQLSPGSKFLIWYDNADSSWYARSTAINDTKVTPLTKILPVKFYNELHDSPSKPSPYGIAGWAPDDRFVYIYDRYDIWRLDPAGERVPVSVTQAFGRRNNIQLRYVKTDPDAEYIDGPTFLLRAFNEKSLQSGFYEANFTVIRPPEVLISDDVHFSFSAKAKNAGTILWSKEHVSFPSNLWVSDLAFRNAQQISNINQHQSEYNWTTAELIEWNDFSGQTIRGILYKPENFDARKKYPLVVYFYERSSDGIHRYPTPAPSRSTISRSMYASNGYLVFVPDIIYTIGYPGENAYNAIVSGVHHLISTRPYVDKQKIGLQGQSWGGYQAAYLITRTNMFAAAMAGAPVSNMTSAYGGIRWETGLSRMFQYEQTQSRIGGTLWEKPMHYIENSPLFYATRIETPLLMMHNDNDGAVPWYQGIELFVALRRLGKPVWMLNYNNEPHNLRAESWANRMDLDRRMFQFFNHYLKGESMPEWLEYGLPAVDKGRKLGY